MSGSRTRPEPLGFSSMRYLVVFLSVSTLLISCGLKNNSPGDVGTPTPGPSLASGLQAIRIARKAVPSATGVARANVSFPRANGTAEYWSVIVFDSESPTQYQQVEIQGNEVVEIRISNPPADSGVPLGFEVLRVDTLVAERTVRRLSWDGGSEFEVLLNPVAFDIGGEDAPTGRRGRGTWHFVVTRRGTGGPELLGTARVSVETGEVVEVQRAQ